MALSTLDMWETFYAQHQDEREWYVPTDVAMDSIKKIVSEIGKARPRLLHIGCGTSPLCEAIDKGLPHVQSIHTDFSERAIEVMKGRFAEMELRCVDARSMGSEFLDESQDVIVDVGVFDSMAMDSTKAKENVGTMLREILRVLERPGGVYLAFSLFGPEERGHFLHIEGFQVTHTELKLSPLEMPHQPVTHVYVMRTT